MDGSSTYPRPQVLGQIPPDGNIVIEASAGTGKTYTIEHLVVDQLLNFDLAIEEILVVTYTIRATQELKARIRSLIQHVLDCGESRRYSSAQTNECWALDELAIKRLEQALFSYELAPVSTIHGFCHRCLAEYAFLHGRLFDQEHVDFTAFFEQVFSEMLRTELSCNPDLSRWFVSWVDEPVNRLNELKTTLSACIRTHAAVVPELDESALFDGVQRLTEAISEHGEDEFTEKLKRELSSEGFNMRKFRGVNNRLKSLFDAVRLYKQAGSIPGFLKAADSAFFHKGGNYLSDLYQAQRLNGPSGQLLKPVISTIVPWKAAVVSALTPHIIRKMGEESDTKGLISYDDMLRLVWEGLEGPSGNQLVAALRSRYRCGLIDEFQDTDELQWRIFRRIFHESPEQHRLYLVGDAKQAIYGFRNADVFTFIRARDEICRDGGTVVPLSVNYRSTKPFVDACNHLFGQREQSGFFSGTIQYTTDVQAGRPGLALLDASGAPVAPISIIEITGPQAAPKGTELRQQYATVFANEIKRILDPNSGLQWTDGDEPRPLRPSDVFVLTRKGLEAHVIGEALRLVGVSYAYYREDGLFQSQQALDILLLLSAIEDPHERSKRLAAWCTPFFGINISDLPRYHHINDTHRLYGDLLDWNRLAEKRRFGTLFRKIMDRTGIVLRLILVDPNDRALTNYEHIFETLLREAINRGLDLPGLRALLKAFVENRATPTGEDGNVQRLEDERDAVQVMTIHKSKGLENVIVFLFAGFTKLPGDKGLYRFHDERERAILHIGPPDEKWQRKAKQESAEEEQRLLYVAVTRAKGRAYLPYQSAHDGQGDQTPLRGLNYAPMIRRLDPIVAQIATEPSGLFEHTRVFDAPTQPPQATTDNQNLLANWKPDERFLAAPPDDQHYRDLRIRIPVVSSYSRIKSINAAAQDALDQQAVALDEDVEVLQRPPATALPPGMASGVFLHTLIENLDLRSFSEFPDVSSWAKDPIVAATLKTQMERFGIGQQYLRDVSRILYHTFTTPIAVGDIQIRNLSRLERYRREVEFLYPIPEQTHPGLESLQSGKIRIDRGYIKGFIDFLFEHQGRLYFADWKSDMLESYEPHHMNRHVLEHYELQAQLYAVAVAKLLDIHTETGHEARFGGYFYFFLRGVRPSGEGVWYHRPSWDELLSFERLLRTNIPRF